MGKYLIFFLNCFIPEELRQLGHLLVEFVNVLF